MGMELSNYVELSTLALDLNYMKGYEALRESAAWIDLSVRGTIRVNGDDRARLLHAITTNHIQQLTPGTGCYVFFLNAQGRVLADANNRPLNAFYKEQLIRLADTPVRSPEVYAHVDPF